MHPKTKRLFTDKNRSVADIKFGVSHTFLINVFTCISADGCNHCPAGVLEGIKELKLFDAVSAELGQSCYFTVELRY